VPVLFQLVSCIANLIEPLLGLKYGDFSLGDNGWNNLIEPLLGLKYGENGCKDGFAT